MFRITISYRRRLVNYIYEKYAQINNTYIDNLLIIYLYVFDNICEAQYIVEIHHFIVIFMSFKLLSRKKKSCKSIIIIIKII